MENVLVKVIFVLIEEDCFIIKVSIFSLRYGLYIIYWLFSERENGKEIKCFKFKL